MGVKYKYRGQSIAQYCKEYGLSYNSIYLKVKHGTPIEEAIRQAHERYPDYYKNKELLKKERWKTLYKGTKYTYEVSNIGRFRRIGKTGYIYLKPYLRTCMEGNRNTNRKHTLIIKITPSGKPIEINCKKAVAEIFIRPVEEHEVVITINNKKDNLWVDNLLITTKSNLGKITGHKANRKRKVYYYDKIGYRQSFRSTRECAKYLGVSSQTVSAYCNNKIKKPKFRVEFAKTDKFNMFDMLGVD